MEANAAIHLNLLPIDFWFHKGTNHALVTLVLVKHAVRLTISSKNVYNETIMEQIIV